jgi:type II secretion system protein N
MKFPKKKTLGFALYAVVMTGVFLYLLFPSKIVQNRLEEASGMAGLAVKMESLRLSLPLGLKFKNLHVASRSTGRTYLDGESLDLQISPLNFVQKNKKIYLSGKAYGGKFSGTLLLASWDKIASPTAADMSFTDVDLARVAFIRDGMGRAIAGKASGHWAHKASEIPGSPLSAACDLILKKGGFPLQEPFLGASRIDFENGELKAKLQNGVLRVEKLHIIGSQVECSLNGDITLTDEFRQSALNLKGEMILSSNKAKFNVTIGGTLDNPLLRYL